MKFPDMDNVDLAIIALVFICLISVIGASMLKFDIATILSNCVTGIAGLATGGALGGKKKE